MTMATGVLSSTPNRSTGLRSRRRSPRTLATVATIPGVYASAEARAFVNAGRSPVSVTLAEALQHVAQDARDVVVVAVVRQAAAEGDGAHGEDRAAAVQLGVRHVGAQQSRRPFAADRG